MADCMKDTATEAVSDEGWSKERGGSNKSVIRVSSGRLVLCLLLPSDLGVIASTTECMALLGHMSRKDLFNMFDEKERHEIEKVRETAISFTGTRSRLIKSNRNEFLWFEVQSVLQESLDYLSKHKVDVSGMSQAAMASFIADATNKAAEQQQAAAARLRTEAQRSPAATEEGSGQGSTAMGGLGMGMGAGGHC